MKKYIARDKRNFFGGFNFERKDITTVRSRSFTLVELLIAAAILVLSLSGILVSYLACLELAEMSKNSSTALHEVKSKLEEIQNTVFNQIKATYDNATFTLAGFNGMGVSYVDDSNLDLLLINVVFCWRQPNGRVIGEDKNLNGQLDVGEDQNGNGQIDSLVEAASQVFER